jgi:hypothetical protein
MAMHRRVATPLGASWQACGDSPPKPIREASPPPDDARLAPATAFAAAPLVLLMARTSAEIILACMFAPAGGGRHLANGADVPRSVLVAVHVRGEQMHCACMNCCTTPIVLTSSGLGNAKDTAPSCAITKF